MSNVSTVDITEEQYRELAKHQGISGEELDRVKRFNDTIHMKLLHNLLASNENPNTWVKSANLDTGNYKTTYTLNEETKYLGIITTHVSSLVEHKNLLRSQQMVWLLRDVENFTVEDFLNSKDIGEE